MALGISTTQFFTALAGALALLALALTAGPITPSASASSACAKYGDTKPTKLKEGQARGAVRCFINRERRQRGVPKLNGHDQLSKAAQRHNDYMQKKECFDHTCPGERDLAGRLSAVGYLIGGLTRWAYGENIAWAGGSRATPKAIVKLWMNSPGHRANILSPLFRDLGVGFTKGSPYNRHDDAGIYTTDFGLRIG